MAGEADDDDVLHAQGGEDTGASDDQTADTGADQAPPDDSSRTSSDTDPVADLAREMGWAPRDEWRGDPDQWKDAKTFLKTTVDINRNLSKDVRELRQTQAQLARTAATITERAVAEERERLTAQFREAVEAGDAEAAWKAGQQLNRVEQPNADPADEVADFKARNIWFGKDDEATAYAVAHCQVLANKGVSRAEQVRSAEEAVKKRFPELFQSDQPQRQQPKQQPAVNQPARASRPAPREKGVADLPPDARKAGEDFVRRGRIKSLADYAKVYFEENA
jgi:hypothetical protein